MAFVVPAEIGHAPYAVPLMEYLVANFEKVHIIAIKEKLFPALSEDCWLLYADGFGGSTDRLLFTAIDRLEASSVPPREAQSISVHEWRTAWNCRLRPYLIPERARALYRQIATSHASRRLGEIASIGIGYVSGANDFFHLRPSEAEAWKIPKTLLYPTVRNGRSLPDQQLTPQTLDRWKQSDDPMMLLRIPKTTHLPKGVREYLDSEMGHKAREAYKCRMREPWYSVPDVRVPDYFLTYMSGVAPSLVKNSAFATCSNAIHAVHVASGPSTDQILDSWTTPFVRLSCELEGHPLGGGMLKLELSEAARVVLPDPAQSTTEDVIADAIGVLRDWRHCRRT